MGSIVLASWDFNGPEGTTAPSTGRGRFSLAGETSLLLAGGVGSSDPMRTYPPNHCIGIYNFPPQGTAPETAGAVFFVPTTSHSDIRIEFDVYPDALSSRWLRLQFTIDGGHSWNNHRAQGGTTKDGLFDLRAATWYHLHADLSAEAGVSHNADFGFRLVSAFAPGNAVYDACGNHNPYSRFGLVFIDMVTVTAKPVD